VAGGAHDTARSEVAADDHRFAAEFRTVALLHSREERVEVDVDDPNA
jgi:hypothetical protein